MTSCQGVNRSLSCTTKYLFLALAEDPERIEITTLNVIIENQREPQLHKENQCEEDLK